MPTSSLRTADDSNDTDRREDRARSALRARVHATARRVEDVLDDPERIGADEHELDPDRTRSEADADDGVARDSGDELAVEALSDSDERLPKEVDARRTQERGSDALERDAFEDWMRIAQRHRRPLSDADTERYLADAHGEDATRASVAEDLLIRHNVRWMLHCLKIHPGVTGEMLSHAGPLREDLLAQARFGFLQAIRHWSDARARTGEHDGGRKKTLLKYAKYWIDAQVWTLIAPERYRLKQKAAHQRHKVLTAAAALAREGAHAPSAAAIAARLHDGALARLRDAQIDAPTREELRRAGALSVRRVEELLAHVATVESLDEVVGQGGREQQGDRTRGESIASPDASPDDGLIAEERRAAIQRLMRSPDPQLVDADLMGLALRYVHGLPTERGRDTVALKTQIVALVIGRTSDTVRSYIEQLPLRAFGYGSARAGDLKPIDGPATSDATVDATAVQAPTPSSRSGPSPWPEHQPPETPVTYERAPVRAQRVQRGLRS